MNRRQVIICGLIAAVLGFLGALIGEVIGHLAVVLAVLGLLIQHARRVSHHHKHQYQMEILSLWLCVMLGYLIFAGDDRLVDTGSLLLGTAAMFWLPSAIIGAVALRLAHRRAGKKAGQDPSAVPPPGPFSLPLANGSRLPKPDGGLDRHL